MPFARSPRAPVACLLALGLTLACGGRDSARNEADPAAADSAMPAGEADAPAAAPAPDAAGAGGPAPLTVADIDRWEKGMAGELEAVHAAAAKLKTARSGEDSMSAMMGLQEMATLEAGAKAAGVDEERYKRIRSDLSATAGYMTPSLGGIDTTMLSPGQRAELKQGNEAQLERMKATVPAAVQEALRPRAAELRKKDLELVGARLKGAGM